MNCDHTVDPIPPYGPCGPGGPGVPYEVFSTYSKSIRLSHHSNLLDSLDRQVVHDGQQFLVIPNNEIYFRVHRHDSHTTYGCLLVNLECLGIHLKCISFHYVYFDRLINVTYQLLTYRHKWWHKEYKTFVCFQRLNLEKIFSGCKRASSDGVE